MAKEKDVDIEEIEGITETGIPDDDQRPHYTDSDVELMHRFLNKYGIKTDDLTRQEVIEKVNKIQVARESAVQVLSRGQVLDGLAKLLDYVPKGMVGEFKREDDLSISRARAMGWRVFFDEEAKKESSTGAADGRVRLGDLVLMVKPEEDYVGARLAKEQRIKDRRSRRDSKYVDEADVDEKVPVFKI